MNTTKKWRKQADTFHIVYGVSIIVLAVVVALLAHAVITGKDFIGSAPAQGNEVPMESFAE